MLENEKVLHVDCKVCSETLKLETNKNYFFRQISFCDNDEKFELRGLERRRTALKTTFTLAKYFLRV